MKCSPLVDPATGRVIGIACGRGERRRRCATCAQLDAKLECDGCDKALCGPCSVSPRPGLDFCPGCFRPAWRHWLQLRPAMASETQSGRRAAFRAWARAATDAFMGLVQLTDAARRAIGERR